MSDITPEVTPVEVVAVPEAESIPETPAPEPISETIESAVDILGWLSEEELMEAINDAMKPKEDPVPTEPVSFPAEQAEKPTDPVVPTDDMTAEIERLTREVETKIDLEAEIEEMKDALSKEQENSQLIESTWSALITAMPTMQEILESFVKKSEDGTISYDDTAIPAYLNPDTRKRVVENPVIWPLVLALERGEELNIPEFVKALTASRQKSLPRTSEADRPVAPEPIRNSANPAQELTKNKHTISIPTLT